jgi:hypothetical protein
MAKAPQEEVKVKETLVEESKALAPEAPVKPVKVVVLNGTTYEDF